MADPKRGEPRKSKTRAAHASTSRSDADPSDGTHASRQATSRTRTPSGSDPQRDIERVTAERDQLARELAAARARIEALDAARIEAINRIDWVVEALQSLGSDPLKPS